MLNERKGNMLDMGSVTKEGQVSVQFEVPARGMSGVKSRLLSASRGLAVMSSTFAGYKPYAGDFGGRDRGNLLSFEQGTATPFAITKVQDRGAFYSSPGDEVYEDQIVGVHSKSGDLKVRATTALSTPHPLHTTPSPHRATSHTHLSMHTHPPPTHDGSPHHHHASQVNICKAKQLTNMRSSGADEKSSTTPAMQLTLEDAVEYVVAGEFVEVTPVAIRMGKHPKESRFGKK